MKSILAISFLLVIGPIVSCGPTTTLLVNLSTNDLRYCPTDENSQGCIRRLENLGYIRADRLTAEQKASMGLLPHY